MHIDEYRFFITQIAKLETEVETLNDILSRERAMTTELNEKVLELIDKISVYRDAQIDERNAGDEYIQQLEREITFNKWTQYIPGIIVGIEPTDGWGRVEGVVGLGWQIPVTGLFNLK
jgi:hypothetical protein